MSDLAMNREQWTALFRAIGLDDATMHRWHAEFERRHPAQHQAFLEWINLPDEDIVKVRKQSQAG